jgi:predicted PurR-regulated permease PerM
VIAGVIAQWPAIQQQLQSGLAALGEQLTAMGINTDSLQSAIDSARAAAGSGEAAANPATSGLLSSVGSALTAGLSGTFAFLFGVFISATLLYYVLTDWPTIADWLSNHMGGLPSDVGAGIVEDAVGAMRGYFRGTTISGFVVSACIGAAMLIMGVPLAGTVAVVTFLTCYIPFFGAIISGAFAFMIALGSNGLPTAVALLIVVLVTQNVLQTVINARVMGDSLNLHPLVVLVATMMGSIFGGLLGAALGAPLAALFVNAGRRLSAAFRPETTEAVVEERA